MGWKNELFFHQRILMNAKRMRSISDRGRQRGMGRVMHPNVIDRMNPKWMFSINDR